MATNLPALPACLVKGAWLWLPCMQSDFACMFTGIFASTKNTRPPAPTSTSTSTSTRSCVEPLVDVVAVADAVAFAVVAVSAVSVLSAVSVVSAVCKLAPCCIGGMRRIHWPRGHCREQDYPSTKAQARAEAGQCLGFSWKGMNMITKPWNCRTYAQELLNVGAGKKNEEGSVFLEAFATKSGKKRGNTDGQQHSYFDSLRCPGMSWNVAQMFQHSKNNLKGWMWNCLVKLSIDPSESCLGILSMVFTCAQDQAGQACVEHRWTAKRLKAMGSLPFGSKWPSRRVASWHLSLCESTNLEAVKTLEPSSPYLFLLVFYWWSLGSWALWTWRARRSCRTEPTQRRRLSKGSVLLCHFTELFRTLRATCQYFSNDCCRYAQIIKLSKLLRLRWVRGLKNFMLITSSSADGSDANASDSEFTCSICSSATCSISWRGPCSKSCCYTLSMLKTSENGTLWDSDQSWSAVDAVLHLCNLS